MIRDWEDRMSRPSFRAGISCELAGLRNPEIPYQSSERTPQMICSWRIFKASWRSSMLIPEWRSRVGIALGPRDGLSTRNTRSKPFQSAMFIDLTPELDLVYRRRG